MLSSKVKVGGSFNPVAAGMTARATLASEDGVCTFRFGGKKVAAQRDWQGEGRQSEIVQMPCRERLWRGFEKGREM